MLWHLVAFLPELCLLMFLLGTSSPLAHPAAASACLSLPLLRRCRLGVPLLPRPVQLLPPPQAAQVGGDRRAAPQRQGPR